MRKKSILFITISAMALITALSPAQAAGKRCMTFDRFDQIVGNIMIPSRDYSAGKVYTFLAKWSPNGRIYIKFPGKKTMNTGSWKRKGNRIYTHTPRRPGNKRVVYKLRDTC